MPRKQPKRKSRRRQNREGNPPLAETKSSSSETKVTLLETKSTSAEKKDLPPEDYDMFENLIDSREYYDAYVTKVLFDKLKKSGVSDEQIADILEETGCPLDFALLMEDADVMRLMLERRTKICKKESAFLIEIAMRSSYLRNIGALVKYGPGSEERCRMFTQKVFDMINGPRANLILARCFIEQLVGADVIDVYTLPFLELTFETGETPAVQMLLDSGIADYVRMYHDDDLLVHMFGNKNVNVLELLKGKTFYVNAKCGGMGAMHFATVSHLHKNIRILLNLGADPNIRDCHGMTPLFAFGDHKCIELLLKNGADVQAIASNGYTILDMLFHPSLLGIMIAHIALIEARGVPIKEKIRKKIASAQDFTDFYQMCCQQIEETKNLSIGDGLSVYPTLVHTPECIAHFVHSQDIVKKLVHDLRQLPIHTHYLIIMQRNIIKAFVIYHLRYNSVQVLLPMFKATRFNQSILQRIIDYLTFEDLLMIA